MVKKNMISRCQTKIKLRTRPKLVYAENKGYFGGLAYATESYLVYFLRHVP
jgi:poly(A) polymerase Pap1